jgi:hypothetical protein
VSEEVAVIKKKRVYRSGYAAFRVGDGVFFEMVVQANSLKSLKDKIISDRLSGDFWLVCIRQRIRSHVVEQFKIRGL